MRIVLVAAASLAALHAQNRILVNNVNQLYAAVNNSANAGATIHVAAGIYPLSGRLTLAPGMNLEGETALVDLDGDGLPDSATVETVIDGSAISAGAIIEAGRQNRIESLTVVGSGNQQSITAAIGTSSVAADEEIGLVVRGCRIAGTGPRGIAVNRSGPAGAVAGRAQIEGNLISNVGVLSATSVGHGIQVVITGLVSGASLSAIVRGNHVVNSKSGLSIERNPGRNSAPGSGNLDVNSSMNLFERDWTGLGMALVGGGGDSVTIRSVQDRLIGNQWGVGLGLFNSDGDAVHLSLLNTSLGGNGLDDFLLSLSGTTQKPSQNNTIDLLIRGVSASGAFAVNDGGANNQVRLIGSTVALKASNEGIPPTFDPDGN